MSFLNKMVSLKTFVSDYYTFKFNVPTFKSITFNITGKCNFDCLFCECQKLNYKSDLEFEEITDFFDVMAKRGVRSVFIGGGEPFLRKDIWKILIYLNKRGYEISIVSNGFLLADTPIDNIEIINNTVKNMYISLDSSTPFLHNYYRGNKYAFDKAVKSIRKINNINRTCLTITVVITKDNFRNLPEIIKFAKQLNVDQVNFQPFSDSTNFPEIPSKDKKKFLVAPENVIELKQIFSASIRKARHLNIKTNLEYNDWIFDYFLNKDTESPIYKNMVNKFECILPFDDLYIRHNGDVQLCALLPKISSIKEKKIQEVLSDIQHYRNSLKKNLPPECQRCFCGLGRNIKFSIMSHPLRNFFYLKKMFKNK